MTSSPHGRDDKNRPNHGLTDATGQIEAESVVPTKTYLMVGLVLALLTVFEVACIYIPALKSVLALILIGVGIIKFILVAMYFMHLKFDAKVYTGFFVVGAIMAIAIFIGLLGMNPPPGHELITRGF